MLHIYCPHCEETREEEEYAYAGEAHIVRPKDPESLTDAEWGDYVFFRKNPRGLHHEMWHHSAGCRQYFYATRDTYTYAIHETYKVGEAPKVVANVVKNAAKDLEVVNNQTDESLSSAKTEPEKSAKSTKSTKQKAIESSPSDTESARKDITDIGGAV